MTERHYQHLMARSAGAQLLRSQGAQMLPRTSYGDARAADPYSSQGSQLRSSYGQNSSQFGSRSDYYLPSDSHDIRAQLISERRSSLPAALTDAAQSYGDYADTRVLSARSGMAEPFPYPSSQRPGQHQSSPVAYGSTASDLLRARRAEIVAAYGQSSGGGRMGRVGRLDDPVMSKEGLLSGTRRLAGSSHEEQDLAISRVGTGQHSVLGSGAGARQGRDLERYLLAVQPDKLVRYAAACLSPEPAIKRARYAMMTNNVAPPPELDVYSNYRQAKLRRSGVVENRSRPDNRTDRPVARPLGTTSRSGSGRREKEKESTRERRRKSDDRGRGSDKKSDSPGRDNKNVSSVPKDDERPNRVKQAHNGSQSSKGDIRSSGQKQGSVGSKRPSVQAEPPQETVHKEKEDNHVDSDKEDSELGSLGADLSDFEDEEIVTKKKTKKKVSEEPEAVIDAPLDGMIFGCSSVTFYECMKLQLFGLPTKNKDEVMRVAPGTKLFLFNFDTKELSGIFEAVSHGGMMIQPDAFREFGSFPAQVQVCCVEQCPNIHLADFKPAIKENFSNAFKFKFTLNSTQVKDLVRLFRRAARFQQQQLHQRQQGGLLHRYIHERHPSDDYLLGSSQRQRQTYSQHLQASFGLSSISSARVMPLSTKSKILEGSSRKARNGRRKKRKVQNECPKFPKADNCSSLKQPEEMGEADIARNASKTREDDDISNTNLSVIVRKVIVTDSSKNFYQQKEIVEAIDAIPGSKGSDPPEPDHEIGTSNPGEFPGLQSDHEDCDGKQVSFVEDGSNDGKCGLAGGRSEEQGKGLNVLKGALDNRETLITKSSDSTPPASGVHEGLSIIKTPQLLVNFGSPPKDDVKVGGEVQCVDKVGVSQVITFDDGLDVGETRENESSIVGCSASFWDQEASERPLEGSHSLLVDDPGEEDGDTSFETSGDGTGVVEISLGDSGYTVTEVADSERSDRKGERKQIMVEQMYTITNSKEGQLEVVVPQREEIWDLTDQQKGEDRQNGEFTNLESNSDKDVLDSGPSDNLICDAESMSPRVTENDEMVDIGYDDVHCEIPDVEVEVMNDGDRDVRKVEDVEQVTEVGDKDIEDVEQVMEVGEKDIEDVEQVMEIEDGVVEVQGLQGGKDEALEVENDSVTFELPKTAENDEDVMDDESGSEIPLTSESEAEDEDGEAEVEVEDEDEDEDELGWADEASTETPDDAGADGDEETVAEVQPLEVDPSYERPQMYEVVVEGVDEDVIIPLSEAAGDGDLGDNDVNGGMDCDQGILGLNVQSFNREEEEEEEDTETRCGFNEPQAKSEEIPDTSARIK